MKGALTLLVALLVATAGPVLGQSLSGSAVGYNVQHRILFQGSVRERTGLWFGGEGAVRLGRTQLTVSGLLGELSGDTSAANPDTDVRASSVALHAVVLPTVLIGVEAEARRFNSDAGVVSWRLIGVNARGGAGLGISGLTGTAEVSYFASASVIGGEETINPAFRGSVGVSYQAPQGPLSARLGYRFERFDFEAAGAAPARKEQFRGVTAGIGVRLGRR